MRTDLATTTTSNATATLDNIPRTETMALIATPISSAPPPPTNITQLFEEGSGNTGGVDQPRQDIVEPPQ